MNKISKDLLDSLPAYTTCANLINLSSIAKNFQKIQKMVGENVECAGVVKANAYGFGAEKVAQTLYKSGCRNFVVATADEGIAIREAIADESARIIVLGGVFKNAEKYFIAYNLTPVIVNHEQLNRWAGFAEKIGQKLDCWLHVDTGMIRNGFPASDMKALSESENVKKLNVLCIMSHLACADDVSSEKNQEQRALFEKATSYFPGVKKSLSATNGIFLGSDYFYDIVRPGKGLYGFAVRPDYVGTFAPVAGIYARILQINEICAGTSIGYGATFVAERKTRTATIGMGYADGFMRKYSGCGCVYIDNFKAPVLGRISMDYAVVDITDIPAGVAKTGEWAGLVTDTVTLEQFALDNNSLPHEIMCKLGSRVRKVYYEE